MKTTIGDEMASNNSEPEFNNFYTPENEVFCTAKLYETLDPSYDDFRLLKVLPGKGSDRIQCTLIQPPETRGLEYECISYRAGDPADILEIEVNGHPFNAFASLGAALCKIRLPDRSRLIWADQICINQSDVAERSSQVSNMRVFYERAECVIAWLGALQEGENAFRAMQELRVEYNAKLLDYKKSVGKDHKLMKIEFWSIEKSVADGMVTNIGKQAILSNLFRSELWSRVWIWQELIVAKKISLEWDTHSIDYDDLLIVSRILGFIPYQARLLIHHKLNNPVPFHIEFSMLQNRRRGWQRGKFLDIKQLLVSARLAGATDPRDKVFAVCGLIDPAYSIVPDYMETVQQIYCRTTVAIMLQERSLDILAFCKHPRRASFGSDALPTWCPDWSSPPTLINKRSNLLWDSFNSKYCAFQASKQREKPFEARATERHNLARLHMSLLAQGLPIGLVQNIGNLAKMEGNFDERMFDDLLASWAKLVTEHCPLTEEILEELEKTAILDHTGFSDVDVVGNVVHLNRHRRMKNEAVEGNWRFFTTSTGLMGMAPPHVEVDDLVVVLLGARVPFLLRKCEVFYTLVGEAFISNGYMYGRAIDEMIAGKIQVQEFDIR
jgi:hypothetical protein